MTSHRQNEQSRSTQLHGYDLEIANALTQHHYQQFLNRGFNTIQITQLIAEGLHSVTAEEVTDLGFVTKDGKPYLDCGGWVFQTSQGFIQFRPDNTEKYSKYLNPTNYRAKVHIPAGAKWITEGVVDAYCCTYLGLEPTGVCAGVSHYKAALEQSGLNWLFDADGWTNPQVFTNLVNAGIHTNGKIQLFPKVTETGKDGAEEFFKAGKTKHDLQAVLESAYTPTDFLFELPKHWGPLTRSETLECAKALIKLAVQHIDKTLQMMLWDDLRVILKIRKDHIEELAKQAFWTTPEGIAELEQRELEKLLGHKSEFLQTKQQITDKTTDGLRLNQLTQAIEFEGQSINPGRYKTFVAELIDKDVPREDCTEILGAIAEKNAYSPVQQYLDRVYFDYGESTIPLLDQAASRLLNPAQPLPIYDTYLRRWMIGAVARAYHPGCKFDHVLILQGKQGMFKSTFFNVLAGDDFFDDNLGDLANIKDELLLLHMAWIHEWAEFDRVTGKREMSIIKSFVTRREDRFRAPYDRAVMPHKRASVLCGTVNENQFLVDDENRRFWVVPVAAPVDIEIVRAERDKLWAAAVALYKRGELPTLTRDETGLNALLNSNYQHEDTWEDAIARFLKDLSHSHIDANENHYFKMADVLTHGLGIDLDKQDRKTQGRVRKILNKLGCKSAGVVRLVGLGPTRCWHYPTKNVTQTLHPVPEKVSALSKEVFHKERYTDVTSSPREDFSHFVTSVTSNSIESSEKQQGGEDESKKCTLPPCNDPEESVTANDVTDVTSSPRAGFSFVTSEKRTLQTLHPVPERVSDVTHQCPIDDSMPPLSGEKRLKLNDNKSVTSPYPQVGDRVYYYTNDQWLIGTITHVNCTRCEIDERLNLDIDQVRKIEE